MTRKRWKYSLVLLTPVGWRRLWTRPSWNSLLRACFNLLSYRSRHNFSSRWKIAHLRENKDYLASYFRKTAYELNNISISLLYFRNHQVALENIVDAIRILKYTNVKGGNKAEYRNYADESIGRAVTEVRREDGQLPRDSSNIHLYYGSRSLNYVDLDKTDIFHRTKEEFFILLFNMALIHQNHGTSNSTHASLQKYLLFRKLVLDLFGVK